MVCQTWAKMMTGFCCPLNTPLYVCYREIKILQTLHRTLHSLRISLILRTLYYVGFEAKILHKPYMEPYMGTKRQRDKERKRLRDKESKSQRDEETKRQRDEESRRQRDKGSLREGSTPLELCQSKVKTNANLLHNDLLVADDIEAGGQSTEVRVSGGQDADGASEGVHHANCPFLLVSDGGANGRG